MVAAGPKGLRRPGPWTLLAGLGKRDNQVVNVTVADVMTQHVVTVALDTPFKQIAEILHDYHITAVPVIDSERGLLGIVSEDDLLERRGEDAADVMSSPVITTRPGVSVVEAARLMHRHRIKRLPVVDAGGKLVGIVSRADLLETFLRSDEAIRREINESVLRDTLWIDPRDVRVTVREGIVMLEGQVESKSLQRILVRMVQNVPGVIRVEDRVDYRLDDSHLAVEPPPGALQYSADQRAGVE